MALDPEELNKRRQERAAYQKKRQRAMYLRLVIAAIVLTTVYSGVEYFIQNWKVLWD